MKKLIVGLLLLFSCNNWSKNTKPSVLVTVAPYVYFVKEIAGNAVDVEVLVPPGANPHIYEPSPKQVHRMANAQIWFLLGEPIEKKVLTVLREQNRELRDIDLTQGIDLLSSQEHVCEAHHTSESKDRHIWLSPKLAQIQAKTIFDALVKAYPDYQEAFQAGFDTLSKELIDLDLGIKAKLLPFHGNAILVSHPAFGYYCQEYGLKQLSIECEGKDPLPRDIEKTLNEAEKLHVKSIFTQAQYNTKGALLISEKLHLPIHEVDPYSTAYIQNLNHITDLIANGH